jgi:hypothetical protein
MKSRKVSAAFDYRNLVGLGMFACSVFVANVLLSTIDLVATEFKVPVCNSSLCGVLRHQPLDRWNKSPKLFYHTRNAIMVSL